MTPEEKTLLIRIDERVNAMLEKHSVCSIPQRVNAIERKLDRIEGGVALLILLVALGRFHDYFGAFFPEWLHELFRMTLNASLLSELQLSIMVVKVLLA
jgi:hypothetical protein